MTDVMTPAQRSRCMAKIQGKNTAPETVLRTALWATGLRYRIHAKLPGKPDIVFPRAKIVVFIDGCFWHRCPLHGAMPRSNAEFWERKLNGNVVRDRRNEETLKRLGWYVVRYWEHQVESELEKLVREIRLLVARKKQQLEKSR